MNSIKDLLQAVSDNPSVVLRIHANPFNHSVTVVLWTTTQKSGHEFLLEDLNKRTDAEERIGCILTSMLKEISASPRSNPPSTTL